MPWAETCTLIFLSSILDVASRIPHRRLIASRSSPDFQRWQVSCFLGLSLVALTSGASADELEAEEGIVEIHVESEDMAAVERASVFCQKNVRRTWGTFSCTSSGGAYTIKEVRFDCAREGDEVVNNVTVNGT